MLLSPEASRIEFAGHEIGALRRVARERAFCAADEETQRLCDALGDIATEAFFTSDIQNGDAPMQADALARLVLTDDQVHLALDTIFWYVERMYRINDSPLISPPTENQTIAMYLEAKNYLDAAGITEITNRPWTA